jgi:2-C-methyl-D-erythritol 4-phosphate cytidylyltransferase
MLVSWHKSELYLRQTLRPFAQDNDWVLVHDAARPCVKASEIENLIKQLKDHPVGGLLATKVFRYQKRGSLVRFQF